MAWSVIGVHCATLEERTGLVHGVLDDTGALEIKRATLGTAGESPAATVAGWITGSARHVIAFDAPLGWPVALGGTLASHRAGKPMGADADQLFRRETDRFVRAALGKLPSEIGADRAGRTARAALELLNQIRNAAGLALPLAWQPGKTSGAIEVQPAATLFGRGIVTSAYKGNTPAGRKARTKILERLRSEFRTSITADLLVEDADIMDAVVCALAAADFARGHAIAPQDRKQARREGWIWFRGSGQGALF